MNWKKIGQNFILFPIFFSLLFFNNHSVYAEIPQVDWPEPITRFCLYFLNSCYVTCYKNTLTRTRRRFNPPSPKTISLDCRLKCWNTPARKQLCRMNEEQLLKLAAEYERQEKERLEEQKRLEERQRREEKRLRRIKYLQALREKRRLLREKEELRRQQERLREARRAFNAKLRELKRKGNITQKEIAELKEARRAILLKQKTLREEKRRLFLQMRLMAKKLKLERQRRLAERRRLEKLERLRKAQLKELQRLRAERLAERRRLEKLKKLAQMKIQLAKKRARLAELQRLAAKRQYERMLRRLKKKEERLAKMRARLQRKSRTYRRKRSKGIDKLTRLNRRATRYQRPVTVKRLNKGQRLFNRGKIHAALQWFEQHEKENYLNKLKEFLRVYRQGKAAHQSRNADKAIPKLERAYTLDIDIGEGHSRFTRLIRLMLANMYVSKGMLALSQHFYPSAFIYFSTAKRHHPKHFVANAKLLFLQKLAQKYYKLGKHYQKNNPQLARKYMRKVIRIVPRKSSLYKKARKILDR